MAPAVDFSPRRRLILVTFAAAALLHMVSSSSSEASPVPALYVLGDSLADVGNNNNMLTIIRADYTHYGIDYPGRKATGRFSNGKILHDFLAEHLNLATPPASRSIPNWSNNSTVLQYMKGVNFASAGAGVSSFVNMGLCISFDGQIEDYSRVHASLVEQLGYTEASRHLASSIFVINIGSNDIRHYVMPDRLDIVVTRARNLSPKQFIDSLIHSLTGQLQALYRLGARKLVFVGAGPIGCCPQLRRQSRTKDCDAEMNDLSSQYNRAVASLLESMSGEHPDMSYSFFDAFAAMLPFIQQPEKYGFEEARAACCGIGDLNAMAPCTPLSTYCANRTNHVFWDLAHPTETTFKKLSAIGLDGAAPFVYPINPNISILYHRRRPAPYQTANSAKQYMTGVNFASAGAGVSNFTYMGLWVSFDEQIQDYSRVHATLVEQLGYTQAYRHLANSIFAVNIGSTDILNYVRMPNAVVSRARNPTHKQLIGSLIHSLTGQLQTLYRLGARKLLFVGAGPIGCCPLLRLQSWTKDCDAEANDLSSQYNRAVTSLLKNMSGERPDMRYSFDTFTAMLPLIQQPEKYGFEEVRAACCGIGDLNAVVPCTPVSNYCANRTSHVFWDFAHPTEITVKKLSAIGLDGAAPFVYPVNVRQLIALE